MSTCPYCQFENDEHALSCSKCEKAIISPRVFGHSLKKNKSEPNSEQRKLQRNRSAYWSLILGCVSFPPSILYLSLMIDAMISPGGGSDFQGAMFIPLCMIAMAPVGLVSVVLGILGLGDITKNQSEYGKGFALAGIILGIPGSIIIASILYFLLK